MWRLPVAAVVNRTLHEVSDDSSATVTFVAVVAVVADVAVSAFPVNAPMNPVAVIFPVDGLYVRVPSLSRSRLPPVCAPPAVNMIALSSSVFSLSVIVTFVAIAAVPVVL